MHEAVTGSQKSLLEKDLVGDSLTYINITIDFVVQQLLLLETKPVDQFYQMKSIIDNAIHTLIALVRDIIKDAVAKDELVDSL
jgi:hypothetical protein